VLVTDVLQDTAESAADEIRSGGGKAWAYQLDVTDATACAALARRVESEVGPANVVVNNAGIIIRETIDSPKAPENWRRVMDVNVNGIFNVVHAWLPALRQTRGNIINVASIASFVGVGSTLGYSPSKGAVRLFTQALARDLAPDGIRVNAIAPGVIATPMTASTREDPGRLAGFMTRTPLGRVGQPEELIGPIIFLASSMASYVNGVILPVDGGFLAA
jgi:NAD(P)-dependent dehydrogenase (short-subunit alcohol dehydrogenase family)